MKELRCRDAGLDCDFVAQGESVDDVMQKAVVHGSVEHQMEASPELLEMAKMFVRDV